MNIANWGNYPRIKTHLFSNVTLDEVSALTFSKKDLIVRGNGRSCGDSSLNENAILNLSKVKFNKKGMIYNYIDHELLVNSAASIGEVLDNYSLKNILPPVIPGSRSISVGGAIAADVHGKNHHINGSLSNHVRCLDILTASGDLVTATPKENSDLFYATCGGMGLTGIIVSAGIRMTNTETSVLKQQITLCEDMDRLIEECHQHISSDNFSAWVDLSTTRTHGRGVVISGDFASARDLLEHNVAYLETAYSNSLLTVPFYLSSKLFNHLSVKAMDRLYYHLQKHKRRSSQFTGINSFFFPLDAVKHWNRLYGRSGFIQYQFVVPDAEVLKKIVSLIKKERLYSTMGSLKLFGEQERRYGSLSFPMKGYSLSMDFKVSSNLFRVLDYIDEMVAEDCGRVYLAKDSRMKAEIFRKMYGRAVDEFLEVKAKYDPFNRFNSLLAKRLSLQL